jgi:CRP-like cAMP-binding protein
LVKFLTNDLDKKILTYIYKNSDLRKVNKGEALIREGDTDEVIFIILKGWVEVSKRMHSLKKETLAILTSGDIFGETSYFRGLPRVATVVATAPTTLIVIDRDTFEGFNSKTQLLFYKYATSIFVDRKDETEAAEKKYEYKNKQFITKNFYRLKKNHSVFSIQN